MAHERILIIDDEAALRQTLSWLFERDRYEVRAAATGETGLALVEEWRPDVVLTDLQMPGMSGLEVLRTIKSRAAEAGRDLPVIVLTAFGTVHTAVAAMRDGAFDYVTKPFVNDDLRLTVSKALAMRRLQEDNSRMRAELKERYQFGDFVGASPRMTGIYEMVRRIKDTPISVLICGESGTGKELLARSLHYEGLRSAQPFIAVNCGAIPENLFESELFGYRKGAFTGAQRDKVGYFSAAHGGTLFLDEVGEMPLTAQVKVLRALAERKITAVGSTMEESVDVRVVAATNRNLVTEVKAGRFREDLYYRLNVVQIDMPPLRERPEDIPELVRHFIERFAREYGKNIRSATPESMRLLQSYPFPGTVRELANLIERAVALEQGAALSPSALPERVQGALPHSREEAVEPPLTMEGVDLEARLAAVERDYVVRALAAAGNNRTKAAKLLGISFRSMRYRLQKIGLDPDDAEDGA